LGIPFGEIPVGQKKEKERAWRKQSKKEPGIDAPIIRVEVRAKFKAAKTNFRNMSLTWKGSFALSGS